MMSLYLMVFQSWSVSINSASSVSPWGARPPCTEDVGHPFSPKTHRILGLPPPTLFWSRS
jgi:hypothetical protein